MVWNNITDFTESFIFNYAYKDKHYRMKLLNRKIHFLFYVNTQIH